MADSVTLSTVASVISGVGVAILFFRIQQELMTRRENEPLSIPRARLAPDWSNVGFPASCHSSSHFLEAGGAPLQSTPYTAVEPGLGGSVQTRPGSLGRNTFRTHSFSNVDFSLVKDTQITESKTLQFRAEFFNLFNQHAFSPPGQVLGSGSFGVESATALNGASDSAWLAIYFLTVAALRFETWGLSGGSTALLHASKPAEKR